MSQPDAVATKFATSKIMFFIFLIAYVLWLGILAWIAFSHG